MSAAAARAAYVDLVENRYFGNVERGRIAAIRACFTDDAVVTIRHGDNPVRVFKGRPDPGELPLEAFWEHICANYDPRFTEFEHVVDTDGGCCAATFLVTLVPKAGSQYRDRGTLTLRNCNFFWLEGGRIARMIVYYSNPDSGGTDGAKPTGYPPAK
jgi:ketosteroid isomerase-like protein